MLTVEPAAYDPLPVPFTTPNVYFVVGGAAGTALASAELALSPAEFNAETT